MPTSYIKKIAKQVSKPITEMEKKWDWAKEIASKRVPLGSRSHYAHAMSIFNNMVGVATAADDTRYTSESKPMGKAINTKKKPVRIMKKGKSAGTKARGSKSGKKLVSKKSGSRAKGKKLLSGKKSKLSGKGKTSLLNKKKPMRTGGGKKKVAAKPVAPDTAAVDDNGKTWWTRKSIDSKKKYLTEHPNSKMAGTVKAELQERQENGTLTEEDKQLMDSAGLTNEGGTGAKETKAKHLVATVETHTPTVREKGLFKNLIKMGKHSILKRLAKKGSVFHTLAKFKRGRPIDKQDKKNVKHAFIALGKAVLITAAFAGVAFLAAGMLPDVVDAYLKDRTDRTSTSGDETSVASDKATKEEYAAVSHYVDDFTGWLTNQDLSKYKK